MRNLLLVLLLITIGLWGPGARADSLLITGGGAGRIAKLKLQTPLWRYHVLYDASNPLVATSVVAVATRGSITGDNYAVLELVPHVNTAGWTVMSWKNPEDWLACLRQISLDRDLNPEAFALWDVNVAAQDHLPATLRTELIMGIQHDDALAAIVAAAQNPESIVQYLKAMGYPAGVTDFDTLNWRSTAIRDGFLATLSQVALLHENGTLTPAQAQDSLEYLLEIIDSISPEPVTFPPDQGPPGVSPYPGNGWSTPDNTLPGLPMLFQGSVTMEGVSPCFRQILFHLPVDPHYIRPVSPINPVFSPWSRVVAWALPNGVGDLRSCYLRLCTRYERRIVRTLPPNNPGSRLVDRLSADVEQCRAVSWIEGFCVGGILPGNIGDPVQPKLVPVGPDGLQIRDLTTHPWQTCPW